MNNKQHTEVMRLISNLPITEDKVREARPPLQEVENFFREVIKSRINHCVNSLKAHVNEAKVASSIVVWKDGHFSVPVYMALVEAQNQDWDDWKPLIW